MRRRQMKLRSRRREGKDNVGRGVVGEVRDE
jgi:hypothetical protein